MGKYKYMRIMISVDGVMGEEATHKMTDERKECMEGGSIAYGRNKWYFREVKMRVV